VPALLTRTVVLFLALRAIAAPIALPTSSPSSFHHRGFVVRMRCWPPQRFQRFSSTSKLLQLCSGKNKVTSVDHGRFLTLGHVRSTYRPLSLLVPETFRDVATDRLADCLRC
jgi:hypothetical protein